MKLKEVLLRKIDQDPFPFILVMLGVGFFLFGVGSSIWSMVPKHTVCEGEVEDRVSFYKQCKTTQDAFSTTCGYVVKEVYNCHEVLGYRNDSNN